VTAASLGSSISAATATAVAGSIEVAEFGFALMARCLQLGRTGLRGSN